MIMLFNNTKFKKPADYDHDCKTITSQKLIDNITENLCRIKISLNENLQEKIIKQAEKTKNYCPHHLI